MTAIASRRKDKAQAHAHKHGIPKAYGSYEDLLKDPDIDVIFIPLPNSMHAEWTIKAAQAKKHVLCEKPMAMSPDEIEAIQKAATENNVITFEGLAYLHHPQTLKVKELIAAGAIGNIQYINAWLFAYKMASENQDDIRLSTSLGGGCIWDLGIYTVSMIISLLEDALPTEVQAIKVAEKNGVETLATAQFSFKDGILAQMSCGFTTPYQEGVLIIGTRGSIFIQDPWRPGRHGKPSSIILTDSRDEKEFGFKPNEFIPEGQSQNTYTFSAVNPYLYEIEAMEKSVLEGAQPILSLKSSKAFTQCIVAINQAAEKNAVVKLPISNLRDEL